MADQPFLASNSFDGDGVRVVWEFSFEGLTTDAPLTAKPYIDSADVKAELITGTGDAQVITPVAFLFETANSIRVEPAVPVGTILRIYRATENRFPLVNYQDLQSVGASDLDLANRQAVYIVQEARDAARGAGNVSAETLALSLGASQDAAAAAAAAAASALDAEIAAGAAGSADGLRQDLASTIDPAKGAALVPTTPRVVATVAALRTLPDTGSKTAFVLGHTVFALGGGVYSQDASDVVSADDNGSVIVAASGTRWKLTDTTMLTPFHFGARGDKVTDDTVAIQACYDAVKAGGTMYIPRAPGDAYIVSEQAANGYVLNFSRVVQIKADGLFSSLQPAAGTTVNTVLLKPDPAFSYQGMEWEGLALGDPYTGTREGLHGIFIDTDVAGSNLPTCSFPRLNIGTGSVVGARAISHVNNPANNVNGGMYGTTISKCPMLKGGIDLQASGDSNAIHNNVISGPNRGVSASLIAGASLLAIVENNITSLGGAIKISSGSRYKILRNNCEQTAATAGVDYMIDIDGASGTMSTGEIKGNHLGAFTATGILANIRVVNNIGAAISDNVMLPASAGGIGVQIDSGTSGTRVGPNTYGSAITAANRIVDAGTGTVGVVKAATLQNSWVNFGAGYADASFYKDDMGIVHLTGTIKDGTATPGTILLTLPAGFRPAALVSATVSQNAGAGAVFGAVDVVSGGEVLIQAGSNAQFSLDGVSFRAANEANSVSDL